MSRDLRPTPPGVEGNRAFRTLSLQFHSLEVLTLLALAPIVFAGCPSKPEAPVAPEATPVVVKDNRGLLFSFFDHLAELRTVDTIAGVPEHARAEVQVIDPRRRLPGDRVYVVDLRKEMDSGNYRVWIEQRGAWLGRNMPKLSRLRQPVAVAKASPPSRKRTRRRTRPRVRRAKQNFGVPTATKAGQSGSPIVQPAAMREPKVVIYSTAWCPSCKKAVAFFRGKGIRFLELDVEKDPEAAKQYVAVVRKVGLREGAVPVIVVNGKVFQGFSPAQIEQALRTGS